MANGLTLQDIVGGESWQSVLQSVGLGSVAQQQALANVGADGGENNQSGAYTGPQTFEFTDNGAQLTGGLSNPNGAGVLLGFQDPTNSNLLETVGDVDGKSQVTGFQPFTSGDDWGSFFEALAIPAAAFGAAEIAGVAAAGTSAAVAPTASTVAASGGSAVADDIGDFVSGAASDGSSGSDVLAGTATYNPASDASGLYTGTTSNPVSSFTAGITPPGATGTSINSSAWSDFLSSLSGNANGASSIGQLLKGLGGVASGLSGSNAASKLNSVGGAQQQLVSNLLPQYIDLLKNPGSITSLPGFQAELGAGAQAIARQEASLGQAAGGTGAAALAQEGSTLAYNAYNQQAQLLAQGLGINTTAATAPYTNAANVNSSAQAGLAYSLGNLVSGGAGTAQQINNALGG